LVSWDVVEDDPSPTGAGVETRRMFAAVSRKLFELDAPRPKVGRFAILDRLGDGGMGTVYRAYDPDLDRGVAVKILHPQIGDTDEVRTAWLSREAKAMAQLNHPNIVTVHEIGVHDGQTFVAMELVEGGTLGDWMRDHPPEREGHAAAVLELFVQAMRGLAAAHDAGLVHRDLKPANMLIDRGGRLRIADFGLARAAKSEALSTTASDSANALGSPTDATGSVVGTPAYMAPEQFDGRSDARSDQFSLCASFFEAFYGIRAHAGATPLERLDHVVRGRFVEPPTRDIPAWIREALQRGMAAEPADRFPDLHALADLVERRRTPRRRVLASVAAMGLAGAVAFAATRPAAQPEPCDDGATELSAVWNPEQRERLAAAFGDDPLAARSRVEARLDGFVTAWTGTRLEACTSQRDLAPEAYARTIACLDHARGYFTAFNELLALGEADVVRKATAASLAMPAPDACLRADTPALAAGSAMDAETANAVLGELGRAGAARALEKLDDAQRHAAFVLERATAAGDDALVAAAELDLGRTALHRGDYQGALARALAALAAAERGGTFETIARAWIDVGQARIELGEHDDAAFAIERADAFVVRAGSPDVLFADVRVQDGKLHNRRGDPGRALAAYETALAAFREHDGERSEPVAKALSQIAVLAMSVGDHARAREAADESVALAEALHGPKSIAVLGALYNRSRVLTLIGDLDDVVVDLERAMAIAEANPWHRPEYRVRMRMGLAEALSGQNDHEGARAALERAVADSDRLGEPRTAGLARMALGSLAVDQGRWAEADEIYTQLFRAWADRKDIEPLNRSIARQYHAMARAGLGDHAGAIALVDAAIEAMPADTAKSIWMARAQQRRAWILAQAGRRDEAIAEYDRAIEALRAAGDAIGLESTERERRALVERP
jgi:tetratricopeptide (TPR) repeat protein